jgi:hypothetical protein
VLLGPLLRFLERRGAVYAGWAEDVPFTVRNRDGGADPPSARTSRTAA